MHSSVMPVNGPVDVPDGVGHFCDLHVHRSANVVLKQGVSLFPVQGDLGGGPDYDKWAADLIDDATYSTLEISHGWAYVAVAISAATMALFALEQGIVLLRPAAGTDGE